MDIFIARSYACVRGIGGHFLSVVNASDWSVLYI